MNELAKHPTEHHETVPEPTAAEEKARSLPAGKGGDMAAQFYQDYDSDRQITHEDSTRVAWKIDRYLMPIICYIYFCQQLDKSSLSFASVFDLRQAANLKSVCWKTHS